MKDKNMILLIGIILIWLLIIRPSSRKADNLEKFDSGSVVAEGSETVTETATVPVSGYVEQSVAVNNQTVSETKIVDEYPIRSYTM